MGSQFIMFFPFQRQTKCLPAEIGSVDPTFLVLTVRAAAGGVTVKGKFSWPPVANQSWFECATAHNYQSIVADYVQKSSQAGFMSTTGVVCYLGWEREYTVDEICRRDLMQSCHRGAEPQSKSTCCAMRDCSCFESKVRPFPTQVWCS